MDGTTLIHNLNPFFDDLSQMNSSKDLRKSELYQKLLPEIKKVLNGYEVGAFAPPLGPKPTYRAVAWNLERGMIYEGIVETFKKHPHLKDTDILLASETDLGMARSGNRNISQEIARELGFNYFFGPSYINLNKGSGIEADVEDENTLAIHGNSIFSRYPLKDFHLIPLKNNKDKMRGKEKRLGNQQALAATVCLPGQEVRVVCAHLDAHSSKRHRRDQMRTILSYLEKLSDLPTILGGDFNTTTYNSRHAAFAIFGFWVRVAMGVRYMLRSHYPYPDRLFEKPLFKSMEKAGFDYKNFNVPGACTFHYHVEDIKKIRNLNDWIPEWCFRFIDWSLKDQQGRCSFKLDWLAGKNIKVIENSTKVIGDLNYQGREISDHDAVMVDFKV
jgi:endonuclease/exonuclease/phosphatase family metal-dependent hydrolase